MCVFLYLGSEKPLPSREWAWLGRDISVSEAADNPDIATIFSKPHFYSIGTRWTADGCGFTGDHKEAQQSREELARFLERALELVPDLELFVAYHDFGTSGVVPSSFDLIGPSDIRTWMSGFKANDFFLVIRED